MEEKVIGLSECPEENNQLMLPEAVEEKQSVLMTGS